MIQSPATRNAVWTMNSIDRARMSECMSGTFLNRVRKIKFGVEGRAASRISGGFDLLSDEMRGDATRVRRTPMFPNVNPLLRSQREPSAIHGDAQVHRRQRAPHVR